MGRAAHLQRRLYPRPPVGRRCPPDGRHDHRLHIIGRTDRGADAGVVGVGKVSLDTTIPENLASYSRGIPFLSGLKSHSLISLTNAQTSSSDGRT